MRKFTQINEARDVGFIPSPGYALNDLLNFLEDDADAFITLSDDYYYLLGVEMNAKSGSKNDYRMAVHDVVINHLKSIEDDYDAFYANLKELFPEKSIKHDVFDHTWINVIYLKSKVLPALPNNNDTNEVFKKINEE